MPSWNNVIVFFSTIGLGFILDTVFYYQVEKIRKVYADWFYSLLGVTLTRMNDLTVRSLARLDRVSLGPRLLSWRTIPAILLFSYLLSLLVLVNARGHHDFHFYYVGASGIALVILPFLLAVAMITRLVIRLAAYFDSPTATGFIGLFYVGFILIATVIGYRVGGGLLPYVPLWAYRHGFTTIEQGYVFTWVYSMVITIGDFLIYVSLVPFYFYFFVTAAIFVLHLLAKFMERYFAIEVDSKNKKIFTSLGALIAVFTAVVTLAVIPLLQLGVQGLDSFMGEAGNREAMSTGAYINSTVTDPKEKAAISAFGNSYIAYLRAPHTQEQIRADGAKGMRIFFRWWMGKEPPPDE